MAWVYLVFAGVLEIIWAVAMKQSAGFTRLLPTTVMFVTMAGSFGLLALAMRALPLGTAYTVWTGLGAIGAFLIGVVFLGEQLTAARIGCGGNDRSGSDYDEAISRVRRLCQMP